jgi:hypothetical protein
MIVKNYISRQPSVLDIIHCYKFIPTTTFKKSGHVYVFWWKREGPNVVGTDTSQVRAARTHAHTHTYI